jgi:SAM-dependent methyltransferase
VSLDRSRATHDSDRLGLLGRLAEWTTRQKSARWVRKGRVAGRHGYVAAKWFAVERALATSGEEYGRHDPGIDERIVEYPWAFARMAALHKSGEPILDAGSVLNHPRLLSRCKREGLSPLSIVTLRYEGHAEVSDDVRYEFADLRVLPYRDEWFSLVVSLSTLEHVGMDNTGYGDSASASGNPNREVARALEELARVTRPGGSALISVPFGTRADRGWLRVLDEEDLDVFGRSPRWRLAQTRCFRAHADGWRECSLGEAGDAGYNEQFDPRRRITTAPDHVAAAEAVALLELARV